MIPTPFSKARRMRCALCTQYPPSPKRQRAWPYLPTIAIWISWAPIHHDASTLCFAILLMMGSNEFRFYHLLQCIEQMLHPPSHTALEIRSQPPSAGACAHQTIDTAPITHWPSALWAQLWQYNELCRAILDRTTPLPLTTPIVRSQVIRHLWEEHELWQLNHSSTKNMDVFSG